MILFNWMMEFFNETEIIKKDTQFNLHKHTKYISINS